MKHFAKIITLTSLLFSLHMLMDSITYAVILHRDQVAVILQHHINVQSTLSKVQAFPLLKGEMHSHILECQQTLGHVYWRIIYFFPFLFFEFLFLEQCRASLCGPGSLAPVSSLSSFQVSLFCSTSELVWMINEPLFVFLLSPRSSSDLGGSRVPGLRFRRCAADSPRTPRRTSGLREVFGSHETPAVSSASRSPSRSSPQCSIGTGPLALLTLTP